ncbi:MAG: class I SAM-dependent methyltransferase [Wenzhouxiangellaceae bacterium]|nr:class I SAM-dependent methyltransferase [Wenzhouxiangellaceae bacterium]
MLRSRESQTRALRSDDALSAAASSNPPMPPYLSGHYRWAYLWRPGVWFFDHMPIINCIVFGQYQRIVAETLKHFANPSQAGSTLLIGSAYGSLVPDLAKKIEGNPLTVIDVAPIQVARATQKLEAANLRDKVTVSRMDAEHLEFDSSSFDSALAFLLLNELPTPARRRALTHAIRVLKPGAQLILTEYGELGETHALHRLSILRWMVTRAEPHLDSLWRNDLSRLVDDCARDVGKRAHMTHKSLLFNGFYRIKRFEISDDLES